MATFDYNSGDLASISGDQPGYGSIINRMFTAIKNYFNGVFVGNANIEDGAVTATKLGTSIDGDGIDLSSTKLSVDLSALSGMEFSSAKLKIKPDDSTLEIAASGELIIKNNGVVADKIPTSVVGNGLQGLGGSPISIKPDTTATGTEANVLNVASAGVSVKIDDITIEANGSNRLAVKDDGITTDKISASAITTSKLRDANVTAVKLASDSVETAKIKDLNVTAAKLATDSVETAKIKDLNVTVAKIAALYAGVGPTTIDTDYGSAGSCIKLKYMSQTIAAGDTHDFSSEVSWGAGYTVLYLLTGFYLPSGVDVTVRTAIVNPFTGVASCGTTTSAPVVAGGDVYVLAIGIKQ